MQHVPNSLCRPSMRTLLSTQCTQNRKNAPIVVGRRAMRGLRSEPKLRDCANCAVPQALSLSPKTGVHLSAFICVHLRPLWFFGNERTQNPPAMQRIKRRTQPAATLCSILRVSGARHKDAARCNAMQRQGAERKWSSRLSRHARVTKRTQIAQLCAAFSYQLSACFRRPA